MAFRKITVCYFEDWDTQEVWDALSPLLQKALVLSTTTWEKEDEDDLPEGAPAPLTHAQVEALVA